MSSVAWEEKEGKRREGRRKALHKIKHCHVEKIVDTILKELLLP